MTHIVIITHTYDNFANRKFLLSTLARHWIDAGHQVSVTAGMENWPQADVAIMHVDLSVVPAVYSQACKRYPIVVNASATDIRKTRISRDLVKPNDGWTGPVIVKTDLNYSGIPEWLALQQFRRDGKAPDLPPGPVVATNNPYPILNSPGEVPEDIWNNPGLIVERFLPEQDAQGFALRIWVFFGDRERCTRYCGPQPIMKGPNIVGREPAPVPELLREERERLGFDYGKFDFVVREGRAILFDANRTPGAPPSSPEIDASNADLALGLHSLLRKAR